MSNYHGTEACDRELLFLVAQFLASSEQLTRTSTVLQEELQANGLLGDSTDWLGRTSPASFSHLTARFPRLPTRQLAVLCERKSAGLKTVLRPFPPTMNPAAAAARVQEHRLATVARASVLADLRVAHHDLATLEEALRRIKVEAAPAPTSTGAEMVEAVAFEGAAASAGRRQENELERRRLETQSTVSSLEATKTSREARYLASGGMAEIADAVRLLRVSGIRSSFSRGSSSGADTQGAAGSGAASAAEAVARQPTASLAAYLAAAPLAAGGRRRAIGSCRTRAVQNTCPAAALLPRRFDLGKVLNGHGISEVYCVAFDQTGQFLCSGADDFIVKVWPYTALPPSVWTLPNRLSFQIFIYLHILLRHSLHMKNFGAVHFLLQSEHFLFSAAFYQVWALDTAELLHSLRGHLGEITDLAVSPNNVLLASSDTKQVVRVWALATGAPVAVLKHGACR